MSKKVIIIGAGGQVGKTTLAKALTIADTDMVSVGSVEDDADLVVKLHDPRAFTVNDVVYHPRPKSKGRKSYHQEVISEVLSMGASMPSLGGDKMKSNPLPNDIIKEYELIQRKESKLPSNMRRRVVNRFNYLFKKK